MGKTQVQSCVGAAYIELIFSLLSTLTVVMGGAEVVQRMHVKSVLQHSVRRAGRLAISRFDNPDSLDVIHSEIERMSGRDIAREDFRMCAGDSPTVTCSTSSRGEDNQWVVLSACVRHQGARYLSLFGVDERVCATTFGRNEPRLDLFLDTTSDSDTSASLNGVTLY